MTVTPKQLENLKKGRATRFVAGERQVRIAKKGKIASDAAKQKNKTFRECAIQFMGLPVNAKMLSKLAREGVENCDATHAMMVIYGLFMAAAKGNGNAAKTLFELMGDIGNNKEKQTENTSSMQSLIDALGRIEG